MPSFLSKKVLVMFGGAILIALIAFSLAAFKQNRGVALLYAVAGDRSPRAAVSPLYVFSNDTVPVRFIFENRNASPVPAGTVLTLELPNGVQAEPAQLAFSEALPPGGIGRVETTLTLNGVAPGTYAVRLAGERMQAETALVVEEAGLMRVERRLSDESSFVLPLASEDAALMGHAVSFIAGRRETLRLAFRNETGMRLESLSFAVTGDERLRIADVGKLDAGEGFSNELPDGTVVYQLPENIMEVGEKRFVPLTIETLVSTEPHSGQMRVEMRYQVNGKDRATSAALQYALYEVRVAATKEDATGVFAGTLRMDEGSRLQFNATGVAMPNIASTLADRVSVQKAVRNGLQSLQELFVKTTVVFTPVAPARTAHDALRQKARVHESTRHLAGITGATWAKEVLHDALERAHVEPKIALEALLAAYANGWRIGEAVSAQNIGDQEFFKRVASGGAALEGTALNWDALAKPQSKKWQDATGMDAFFSGLFADRRMIWKEMRFGTSQVTPADASWSAMEADAAPTLVSLDISALIRRQPFTHGVRGMLVVRSAQTIAQFFGGSGGRQLDIALPRGILTPGRWDAQFVAVAHDGTQVAGPVAAFTIRGGSALPTLRDTNMFGETPRTLANVTNKETFNQFLGFASLLDLRDFRIETAWNGSAVFIGAQDDLRELSLRSTRYDPKTNTTVFTVDVLTLRNHAAWFTAGRYLQDGRGRMRLVDEKETERTPVTAGVARTLTVSVPGKYGKEFDGVSLRISLNPLPLIGAIAAAKTLGEIMTVIGYATTVYELGESGLSAVRGGEHTIQFVQPSQNELMDIGERLQIDYELRFTIGGTGVFTYDSQFALFDIKIDDRSIFQGRHIPRVPPASSQQGGYWDSKAQYGDTMLSGVLRREDFLEGDAHVGPSPLFILAQNYDCVNQENNKITIELEGWIKNLNGVDFGPRTTVTEQTLAHEKSNPITVTVNNPYIVSPPRLQEHDHHATSAYQMPVDIAYNPSAGGRRVRPDSVTYIGVLNTDSNPHDTVNPAQVDATVQPVAGTTLLFNTTHVGIEGHHSDIHPVTLQEPFNVDIWARGVTPPIPGFSSQDGSGRKSWSTKVRKGNADTCTPLDFTTSDVDRGYRTAGGDGVIGPRCGDGMVSGNEKCDPKTPKNSCPSGAFCTDQCVCEHYRTVPRDSVSFPVLSPTPAVRLPGGQRLIPTTPTTPTPTPKTTTPTPLPTSAGLRILSLWPKDGAMNISRLPIIRIEFSQPMLRHSVEAALITSFTYTHEWENDTALTLQPVSPLAGLTAYAYSVGAGAQSQSGERFPFPYVFGASFTTNNLSPSATPLPTPAPTLTPASPSPTPSPTPAAALGFWEFLDTQQDWTRVSNLPVPGKAHLVVASNGSPDIRQHLPISITLTVNGSSYWAATIANNPTQNCRDATGCSIDGPQLSAELQGASLRIEARGSTGALLATHMQ